MLVVPHAAILTARSDIAPTNGYAVLVDGHFKTRSFPGRRRHGGAAGITEDFPNAKG